MTENAFHINSLHGLEILKAEIGLEEARRLGFVTQNENGVIGLTVIGHVYISYIKAPGVHSLSEAFAAGWHYSDEHRQNNSGAS